MDANEERTATPSKQHRSTRIAVVCTTIKEDCVPCARGLERIEVDISHSDSDTQTLTYVIVGTTISRHIQPVRLGGLNEIPAPGQRRARRLFTIFKEECGQILRRMHAPRIDVDRRTTGKEVFRKMDTHIPVGSVVDTVRSGEHCLWSNRYTAAEKPTIRRTSENCYRLGRTRLRFLSTLVGAAASSLAGSAYRIARGCAADA